MMLETKWIVGDWMRGEPNVTTCPDCKHEFDTGALYAVGNLYEGLPRYCPNCGGKIAK